MKTGAVLHTCISDRKGIVKTAVDGVTLRENRGVEGDAHAGDWHRQVSLLDEADIDTMRAKGIDLAPGAFGENIVVGELDLNSLGIGTRLRLGEAAIEITQIGKVCHSRCAIYYRTGDCIMPRAGVFARVLAGGSVKAGDAVGIEHEVSRDTMQAAVVTVSDRCAAGEMKDTAGPAVAEMLSKELSAHIAWTGVVPDDVERIVEALKDIADRSVHLIVTVGGTGCSPRDVTPEATRTVISREVPGMAEAMRAASMKITRRAMLQRGICGVRGSTLIVNMPGSEKGATENLAVILPAIPHALRQIRGETDHRDTDLRERLVQLGDA